MHAAEINTKIARPHAVPTTMPVLDGDNDLLMRTSLSCDYPFPAQEALPATAGHDRVAARYVCRDSRQQLDLLKLAIADPKG